MASKLSVFAALFVCFLVLTEASFRVTTVVDEEAENPQQRRQCQQQIQMPRIHSCHLYMSSQLGGRWNDGDLEMNPQIRGQESIEPCCEQMRQVDRECRCEALDEISRIVQHDQRQQQGSRYSGSSRGGQQQRIQQQVRRIPQMCNVQVPRQCQQQGY